MEQGDQRPASNLWENRRDPEFVATSKAEPGVKQNNLKKQIVVHINPKDLDRQEENK